MKNERKKLIKAAAKAMIIWDLTEWPPGCVGFAYQPMRPAHKPVERKEK